MMTSQRPHSQAGAQATATTTTEDNSKGSDSSSPLQRTSPDEHGITYQELKTTQGKDAADARAGQQLLRAMQGLPIDDEDHEQTDELASPSADTEDDRLEGGQVDYSDDEASEPATLNDKAKELGIEPDELYHLKVTTRDGEEVSVETLKDFYADQHGRDADLNSRDANIIKRQQVLMAAAEAGKLDPAGYAIMENAVGEQVRKEQGRFLDLVPELQEEAKLELFSRDVDRIMTTFGYQRHEMMFTDHRQALFVRGYAQLERELEAERARNKPKPQTARKPAGRKQGKTSSDLNKPSFTSQQDADAWAGRLLARRT